MLGYESVELVLNLIEADAGNFKTLLDKDGIVVLDDGRFGNGRPAPSRPEIDEDDFARKFCQIDFAIIYSLELDRERFAERIQFGQQTLRAVLDFLGCAAGGDLLCQCASLVTLGLAGSF